MGQWRPRSYQRSKREVAITRRAACVLASVAYTRDRRLHSGAITELQRRDGIDFSFGSKGRCHEVSNHRRRPSALTRNHVMSNNHQSHDQWDLISTHQYEEAVTAYDAKLAAGKEKWP